jgi:hypothetical protein
MPFSSLLDSCHPQELLYDLVVESCSAIRVNHVGVTEAAEMLEDARRCLD